MQVYQESEQKEDVRDRLRTAVVSLIQTECDYQEVSSADDVLGGLLHIARDCGFAELRDKLYGWICDDAYSDAEHWDGRQMVSLRTLTWLALLTWGVRREWLRKLVEDMHRDDCRALCFQAITKLNPAKALPLVPGVLRLHAAYARPLVSGLIYATGVELALTPDMLTAWQSCLSAIEHDHGLRYLLRAEGFVPSEGELARGTTLWRALDEVGIRLDRPNDGDLVVLHAKRSGEYIEVPLTPLDPIRVAEGRAARMNEDFQKEEKDLVEKYITADLLV